MPATDPKRMELVFDLASPHPSGIVAVPESQAVAFESWAELFSLLDEALERLRTETTPSPTEGDPR